MIAPAAVKSPRASTVSASANRFGRERSETEVENLDRAICRDHQVVRLDVAMHHAAFVCVLQSDRCLPDVVACFGDW